MSSGNAFAELPRPVTFGPDYDKVQQGGRQLVTPTIRAAFQVRKSLPQVGALVAEERCLFVPD
jgi:hypothetical protein